MVSDASPGADHAPGIHMRLLADHGQFYAFDATRDPVELPTITDDAVRRGWARTADAIYYFTVGQLWSFRLDLFRSSGPPKLDNAERVLSHRLHLPTGRLAVGNPIAADNLATLSLAPGVYSLYLRAFNLGAEIDYPLDDEEFLRRSDLERYELFVAPGNPDVEGVILGRATLW